MKLIGAFLLTLILIGLGSAAAGAALFDVFPPVTVECRTDNEVHENTSGKDEKVVIQVTDNCEGFDSKVRVVKPDGATPSESSIPDGKTKSASFTLHAKDKLFLDCVGGAREQQQRPGKCTYVLSVK